RVEFLGPREAGEQRREIGFFGWPAEPQVAERLANDALEETRQAGRPRRIACRHDRPPLLAAYYTVASSAEQPSPRGCGEILWVARGRGGKIWQEGGTHGDDPAGAEAPAARDARRRHG